MDWHSLSEGVTFSTGVRFAVHLNGAGAYSTACRVTQTTQSFSSAFTICFKKCDMYESISDTIRLALRRIEWLFCDAVEHRLRNGCLGSDIFI